MKARYLLVALLLTSCSIPEPEEPLAEVITSSASSSAQESSVSSVESSPEEITIDALIKLPIVGTDFTVGERLASNAAYDRYAVWYRSNGLKITGVMNVPKGDGPFPLVILNHGYIDPEIYTTGRGLKREQDYLARNGFAVVHTDYRGHAGSDENPDNRIHARYYGYAIDALAAIEAIRKTAPARINTAKVGMLGHSLGGGISMLAAVSHPDLVSALVLYAPISSNAWDNFQKWEAKDRAGELALEMLGTPETQASLWKSMSPVSYFDRLKIPVRIFHGTLDESVPYAWSVATEQALRAANADGELITYPGETHEFTAKWSDFMRRTALFLKGALS